MGLIDNIEVEGEKLRLRNLEAVLERINDKNLNIYIYWFKYRNESITLSFSGKEPLEHLLSVTYPRYRPNRSIFPSWDPTDQKCCHTSHLRDCSVHWATMQYSQSVERRLLNRACCLPYGEVLTMHPLP